MKSVMLMLALASGVASAQGSDVAAVSGAWDFIAALDGKPIGTHRFNVEGPVDSQSVFSRAAFDVSLLKIPVYRYRILDHERWQGDCLRQLRSDTEDDGKSMHVDQEFKGECVMSFAYWNPRLVNQTKLVNPQTGDIETVSFERLRDQTLTVRGQPQLAQGWLLQAPKQRISIWYSAGTGRWIGLDAEVKGGRVLTYRPSPSTSGSAP